MMRMRIAGPAAGGGRDLGRRHVQELARGREMLGLGGSGEQPVVADAGEALWQHVQQEAADDLMRVKPHRLPAGWAVDAIILPAERDAGVVGGDETAVRD